MQAARENARANTCRNSLKQVSLAIFSFDQRRGRYPGFVDGLPTGITGRPFVWRPLLYMILPQLERQDLYDRSHVTNKPSDDVITVRLDLLVCPSDPQSGRAATSYIYNTGMPGNKDNVANGVFTMRWNGSYSPASGGIGGNYVTQRDGTSTTLMLSENIDARNWNSSQEVDIGWVWHDRAVANPPWSINGLKGGRNDNTYRWARPSSNHPASVNVAYCDGHVGTLSEDIQYHVLAQLMTSFGRVSGYNQSATGGPTRLRNPGPRDYILSEADY